MKKFSLIVVFIFLILSKVSAENKSFLPKTFLILPESSNVKIKWIIPPDTKEIRKEQKGKIRFFINFDNEPVAIYENSLIFNPLEGYFIKLKEPAKESLCLENGVMLFTNGNKIGYLEVEKETKNMPTGKIKAIASLPAANAKLFQGENNIYAAVFNNKTKKYEIYIFDNSKMSFKKIAIINEPINALTGKGEYLFFSTGKSIKEYMKGKLKNLYEHPRQEIRELFYNDKVGLIYKTSSGVGFIKNTSALEFLQTENPQIYLKGTSLYVFFNSVNAVMELVNIDDLKNYSFQVEKVIDIKQTF